MNTYKPILSLDFDGVIHGYKSGWKGAAVITDPPVPGALEFIVAALDYFHVNIFSSRSHQWGGRRAMQKWLHGNLLKLSDPIVSGGIQPWWLDYVSRFDSHAEPWDHIEREAADRIIKQIKWPFFKPAAMVSLDDRALMFTGVFPDVLELLKFKPWNKGGTITDSDRLRWLHSNNTDADGWEYGVMKVKYGADGQRVEGPYWTASDHSDIDPLIAFSRLKS